ncbi:MAG: glycosyltransferase [Pseudomonadota bacterium]|nr:glycosyltransferase [Pseudomonadota bacterium]
MDQFAAEPRRRLRIVELGDHTYFKYSYPAETELIWTGLRPPRDPSLSYTEFSPAVLLQLMRRIRRGEMDLLVCYPPLYAPWHPRSFLHALRHYHMRFAKGLFMSCGTTLVRLLGRVPLAVVDMGDSFAINRHNFFLLDRCTAYFKRELPTDHWKVFFKTAHRNLPTRALRRNERYRRRIARLRPISSGVGDPQEFLGFAAAQPEKTADIFFAGEHRVSSTIRSDGLAQIRALARMGYTVDVPEGRIPRDEFYARCARAWLTWSPEGYGWDCYRHYEAPLCGSVPVINYPSIHRHAPLLEGVHCFHYGIEGDDLTRTIVRALADKAKLAEMAAAARDHVLRHHSFRALCDHIIEICLGPRPGESGPVVTPQNARAEAVG